MNEREKIGKAIEEKKIESDEVWQCGRVNSDGYKRLAKDVEVLTALLNSWKSRDPGKRGPVVFLLSKEGKWAVAEELLPEGIEKCPSEKEWREYIKAKEAGDNYRKDHDRLDPMLDIITFEETLKESCPQCGKEAFITEWYAQTEDSPDGDIWRSVQMTVCLNCHSTARMEGTERQDGLRFRWSGRPVKYHTP